MKDIDILLNIIESNCSKKMKYYIAQGKRKISAIRRSAKTPEEAVSCYKEIKSFNKELLDAIVGCKIANDEFQKTSIFIIFFLTAFLVAIIYVMSQYGIGVVSGICALIIFAVLFQVLIITKEMIETKKFVERREPQLDLENFVKTQENMLLDKFKNTRINPYSGKLEVMDNANASN